VQAFANYHTLSLDVAKNIAKNIAKILKIAHQTAKASSTIIIKS